jgi:hypothetical protein
VSLSSEWRDYIVAARRKIRIGDFHEEHLRMALDRNGPNLGPPSVEVQAYFEGVLSAFVAACDQAAEALKLGFGLSREEPNLREALEAMPPSPLRTKFFKWHDASIASDVRAVRRRAAHHHYGKTLGGELGLAVEFPPGRDGRGGSRVIDTKAVVEHLDGLGALLDKLSESIERQNADVQP